MKILLIEDEAAAARRLKKMISEVIKDAEIFEPIDSVEAATKWFRNHPAPDLVFMDIQLADGTCFEILKQTDIVSPVIFTTAYDEYAIRAFEVNAIAYLLKPVKILELQNAIRKLEKLKSGPGADYQKLLESVPMEGSYQKRLLLKIGQTFRAVEVNDIAYFFTQHKIVTLTTFDNRKYPSDYTLEELEKVLDPKHFFRINRQFIINIKSIREMFVISKSRVKINLHPSVENSVETAVSAERVAHFKKWLTEESTK